MAVKNGAHFLREQIDSVIPQMAPSDELIVSDDHSTDKTLEIVKSYADARIRLVSNPRSGIVSNFENCLQLSQGDYIFLCDQDDIWTPNKVESLLRHLINYDLVVSDCRIVGERLQNVEESYFRINRSGKGLIKNLIRNSYMGCCMAFRRSVLEKAIPFPEKIPMHDQWIGLVGELHFSVAFIPDQLVCHRRHTYNSSSTSGKSRHNLLQKLNLRYRVIRNLIRMSYV